MKRNKSIEIEYINEKLEKSSIITMIDDAIIFDSSKEIEKIKESVIGILECTNIEEKVAENSEGRHIYKLNDKVSKHIISTISKDVDIKEKKQIIKDIIKEILNNKSVIIIHGGSIFINDSGVAKEKIIINKKIIENNRFNGYNENELDGLIKEILESDEKLNKLINTIINKIDFEQLSNNDYELLLTKSYKKFILDFFSKEIAKKYNLEKDISNAISGKIFRENFTKISSKIYELLIEKKLEKIIANNLEEIIKNSEETLFLQHFDLSNDHISKKISSNIKDIYLLIISEFKKEIQILIQKKYNINGAISNTLFNLLTKKILDKKINKIKEKLIKKLVDSLIKSISKNSHKLEQTTLDFLRYLSINEIQIKVQYIQNELDALKISSDIKVFLGYIKKIKNELKEKKEKLDKIKKETQSLSNQKAKNEIDLLENKRTINKYFNNIGFKSKSYDQISIFEVMSELKKSKNNKNNIIEEVNDSSSNKIKTVINSKKIQENKEKIKKYEKRIKLLEEIIELMKKNKKNEAKLLKLKNLKEKELNVNKGIISQERELKVFYDKIEQIKDGLFNTLIK